MLFMFGSSFHVVETVRSSTILSQNLLYKSAVTTKSQVTLSYGISHSNAQKANFVPKQDDGFLKSDQQVKFCFCNSSS